MVGSAICVAQALGVYENFQIAVNAMVMQADSFSPIAQNVDLYQRFNTEVYQHITKNTDNILQKSYKIFN